MLLKKKKRSEHIVLTVTLYNTYILPKWLHCFDFVLHNTQQANPKPVVLISIISMHFQYLLLSFWTVITFAHVRGQIIIIFHIVTWSRYDFRQKEYKNIVKWLDAFLDVRPWVSQLRITTVENSKRNRSTHKHFLNYYYFLFIFQKPS